MTPSAPLPGRRVWAAVPFKGPPGNKRRLAGLLDPAERAGLSYAMLADVLGALLNSPGVERVLLLTPAGETDDGLGAVLASLPANAPLTLLREDTGTQTGEQDGLNAALKQAQAIAADAQVSHLLILPADLPLLRPEDVAALLDVSGRPGIVVAPDASAGGTNALVLSPPEAFVPAFGPDSFSRHKFRAAQAGLPCIVAERSALALDLDTPADVAALLATGQSGHAADLLRELHVAERLERLAVGQARSATI